jgi:hypothetical protein
MLVLHFLSLVLPGGAVGYDFTVADSYYPAPKFINDFLIMGGKKYGGAKLINFFQYRYNIPGVFGV